MIMYSYKVITNTNSKKHWPGTEMFNLLGFSFPTRKNILVLLPKLKYGHIILLDFFPNKQKSLHNYVISFIMILKCSSLFLILSSYLFYLQRIFEFGLLGCWFVFFVFFFFFFFLIKICLKYIYFLVSFFCN